MTARWQRRRRQGQRERAQEARGAALAPLVRLATTCASSGTIRAPRRWAIPARDYLGKPIIAIVNTWSDINTCHSHFRQRAEEVKRGVLQAGGFPLEMPAIALAEVFQKPTTMLYRNLLAMETEELLRSYPVDGAVLMGGCDKTTPALLMGAISMNLPAIFMPAGPDAARQLARPVRSAAAPTSGSTGPKSAPAT